MTDNNIYAVHQRDSTTKTLRMNRVVKWSAQVIHNIANACGSGNIQNIAIAIQTVRSAVGF